MYVAVIRRISGGVGVKTAKSFNTPLFFSDTCARNLKTFVTQWPRHITTFLCYGRSPRVEAAQRMHKLSAITVASSRGYGSLAMQELSREEMLGTQGVQPPKEQDLEPAGLPSRPLAEAKLPSGKMNLHRLHLKYKRKQPISMATAYDYPSARLVDGAGIDMVLVGDSLGMVVLGLEDTTSVTMDQMVHHCRAAARGTRNAFVVGDMPFGSYLTPDEAARNAVRLVKEGRADAVKLEGGRQEHDSASHPTIYSPPHVVPQVRALVAAGVAVMGHIGLTPQSHTALGGYRVQGRTAEQAQELVEAARELQAAGCFGIVLEMVPAAVASLLTAEISIPTIGIGAGVGTSGQVQVFHDLLGLYDGKVPRFSRQFGHMEAPMLSALQEYARAVEERSFPEPRHSFSIERSELLAFEQRLHPKTTRRAEGHAATTAFSFDSYLTPAAATRSAIHAQALQAKPAPSTPRVVRTVAEWRELFASRPASKPLGLVPTMGALHAGHLSLENDAVAVSVFVNPRQFAPTEDLQSYPRPWEKDLEALTKAGVDYIFAPSVEEMYPPSQPNLKPFVDLTGIDSLSEGARRPGFFRGVSTVVTKLFNIIKPQRVYFGQKDGLQCIVVRRLIEDLNFDTQLVVGETVREPDGLAMSSRNIYLDAKQRQVAPTVYRALCAMRDLHRAGERDAAALREAGMQVLAKEPLLIPEYISLSSCRDGEEVQNLPTPGSPFAPETMAAIAVKLGTTRLIDNIILK
ncbi:hypothetical protein AB1Y20_011213 [Prymnesium parvum]|uniref:Pantoate--beta-alanine ligase n=1 Tax=Prymnesium parvum TaxID=97485 RepID=A0AB34IL78_PRYPA